jgi:chromosome segregation ATPase
MLCGQEHSIIWYKVHASLSFDPGRYDVAISTACTALNYIVVETASDAQRCVELLRRRSLGVATFLILEKQKGLAGQMNEAVQTPEGKVLKCCCICSAALNIPG